MFKFPNEDIALQPENVLKVLKALLETGTKKIKIEYSKPNRGVVFRDADNKDKLGLVMPEIGRASCRERV